MRVRFIPGRVVIAGVSVGAAGALLPLLFGVSLLVTGALATVWLVLLLSAALCDGALTLRSWRAAAPELSRRLPAALALGVKRPVQLNFIVNGAGIWHVKLVDHSDPTLLAEGMPVEVDIEGGKRIELLYFVTPTKRGEVRFDRAALRLRSRFGLVEMIERIGAAETRRVYPDFAQVARYAWLAGDRRLSEIGIKTYRQRGEGTDFKQLSEYRVGDSLRHIDWKATLRFDKPIVREFQNERDQCVLLLIDCGRRMRAEEHVKELGNAIGSSHFDQVLNAVMLLSYVALKQGDAVGALTFGTPIGEQRWFSPRKGATALNALMGELYSLQPTPTHSDYLTAAKDLLRRQTKRALIVIVTNFRDEDAQELSQAVALLRSRHLVLTASLRERVVRELATQEINSDEAIIEIASAHMYEQARRDAFKQLAAHNALMVDAEPERLGIELVNRYQSAKRGGLI